MIISASYRTDIPAFYGKWFMARLAAGGVDVRNPYGGQVRRVPLDTGNVDAIVFWTRNPAPFLPYLDAVRRRFPFALHLTVTGYPRVLEAGVIAADAAIATAAEIARRYGGRTVVWRYDPILITDRTPPDWHRSNFACLADALAGHVDEVVVSFAHIYAKTRRNLDRATAGAGLAWRDPPAGEKRALLADLAALAHVRAMTLTVCSQPDLSTGIAAAARCIDADRLSDIAGRPITARVKGNRPGCLCHESRDIGAYDSCPHGCVYCYAVTSRDRAKRRHAAHDIAHACLDGPAADQTAG